MFRTLYSGDTIKNLNSYKGQILFPNEIMPSSNNYWIHTYGTNNHTFPFSESDTINPGYHTIMFDLNKSNLEFKPYNQYLEFALVSFGKDKHIFTKYASINDYYFDNVLDEIKEEQKKYDFLPEKFNTIKKYVLIISSIFSIYLIYFALNTKKRMNRKYNFYESTMKIDYFRDIPSNLDPVFASNFAFCKNKKSSKKVLDGYSAIMLSLVRKGYIELKKINEDKNWTSNNVHIVVKNNESSNSSENLNNNVFNKIEPLSKIEELYFNLIVRYSYINDLTLKIFQDRISIDYENTNSFVNNVENSITNIGVSEGYFQNSNYEKPKNELKSLSLFIKIIGYLIIIFANSISITTRLELAFGSFFLLGTACIICGIILKKKASKFILLTQKR